MTHLVLSLLAACLLASRTQKAGVCNRQNDFWCPSHAPCCSNWGYCGATANYCAYDNCIAGPCWSQGRTEDKRNGSRQDRSDRRDDDDRGDDGRERVYEGRRFR